MRRTSAGARPTCETVENRRGMHALASEEGEHAMRLLTRHDAGFEPRLIQAIEDLLREETDAARAEPILRLLLRADA
jgi:hypothetical protein